MTEFNFEFPTDEPEEIDTPFQVSDEIVQTMPPALLDFLTLMENGMTYQEVEYSRRRDNGTPSHEEHVRVHESYLRRMSERVALPNYIVQGSMTERVGYTVQDAMDEDDYEPVRRVGIPLGSHGILMSIREDSCIYMDDPRFGYMDSIDAKGEFDFHEDCLYTSADKDERRNVADTQFDAVGLTVIDANLQRYREERMELQSQTERLVREYNMLREVGMDHSADRLYRVIQASLGLGPND